jgi:hypothetical protein
MAALLTGKQNVKSFLKEVEFRSHPSILESYSKIGHSGQAFALSYPKNSGRSSMPAILRRNLAKRLVAP